MIQYLHIRESFTEKSVTFLTNEMSKYFKTRFAIYSRWNWQSTENLWQFDFLTAHLDALFFLDFTMTSSGPLEPFLGLWGIYSKCTNFFPWITYMRYYFILFSPMSI